MKISIEKLKIKDAYKLVQPIYTDHRGSFTAWWEEDVIKNIPISFKPISACHSYNNKANTLRGMHYQKSPFERGKLVTCVSGKAWDVIVDLRPQSPTFLTWDTHELDSESGTSIFVPRGCAHGFITLLDNTTIAYLIDGVYNVDAGAVLRWNDPLIGINWPTLKPILSDKDKNAPDYRL